ncbi:MAG: 6-phosphogluconolactonase [Actinomycetota bacterium]|nr:6-phosphogluconolactonase [Actinomycetota bacterium]
MRIRVFNSAEALADAAADEVEGWLRIITGRRTIGLSGGSTPRRAYELLAERRMGWADVEGWLTDERHVPPNHEDCNAGMIRRALFDHVPATLHEVPWEEAQGAAVSYENTLRRILPPGGNGRPQPGLVLLGVGEDGHTASLFPGSPALEERERDFIATKVDGRGWRFTATIPLLTRARRTLFVASGRRKAEIVAQILEGDVDLPAARVSRSSRDPLWLLDADAASALDEFS